MSATERRAPDASTNSSFPSTSSSQFQLEKYSNIQCDDLSDLVSVGEFKKRCGELHAAVWNHVTDNASDGDHVGEVEIAEACNTADLLPPGGLDPYLKGKKPSVLQNTQLECLNRIEIQKNYFEQKGLTLHSASPLPSHPTELELTVSVNEEAPNSSDTVNHPEVVLSLYTYHPIKKRRDTQMLVLGSQLLTELRDKILCFRDFIVDQDYSEDPTKFDHHSLIKGDPPNHSKSAFFFIHNTFYNDRRHPNSQDLSAPIIAWTHETNIEKSPRLDYYYAADMAATRLDQLHLRLGYPYLYCHHQTCQHLVIFTELRLLHPTDSQRLSDYPKTLATYSGQRRKCFMCNIFSPIWVTLEDELAPESPCLFCEDCFKKLHYSTDGAKMCHFKAYPYNPTMLV